MASKEETDPTMKPTKEETNPVSQQERKTVERVGTAVTGGMSHGKPAGDRVVGGIIGGAAAVVVGAIGAAIIFRR
jgi:hypothetical protein